MLCEYCSQRLLCCSAISTHKACLLCFRNCFENVIGTCFGCSIRNLLLMSLPSAFPCHYPVNCCFVYILFVVCWLSVTFWSLCVDIHGFKLLVYFIRAVNNFNSTLDQLVSKVLIQDIHKAASFVLCLFDVWCKITLSLSYALSLKLWRSVQ